MIRKDNYEQKTFDCETRYYNNSIKFIIIITIIIITAICNVCGWKDLSILTRRTSDHLTLYAMTVGLPTPLRAAVDSRIQVGQAVQFVMSAIASLHGSSQKAKKALSGILIVDTWLSISVVSLLLKSTFLFDKILGFHGGDYEECRLLRCDALGH
jgi:hypothetical protein